MEARRHLVWLYEQLPALVEKGLLSQEQAESIQAYYGPTDTKPAYSWAFIALGIIGALLVGGGIILIFAYNWDKLPTAWRTVLSLVPLILALVIYGYMLFRKRHSIAWVEGASAFLMLMLAASISLVSQTYHIMGTTESFLLSWLAPSIALLFVAPSSLCAIIYMIGIASWALATKGAESVWYWGLLVAAMLHVWQAWRSGQVLRYRLTAWALALTLPYGWFGTIEASIALYGLWGSAALLGLLYLLEAFEPEDKPVNPIALPFRSFAAVAICIFLVVLTYWDQYEPLDWAQLWHGNGYAPWAARVNLAVWLAVVVGYGALLIKRFRQWPAYAYFPALFPLFLLLWLSLAPHLTDLWPRLATNAYFMAWGIAYLYAGVRYSRMGLVNLGMLIILALIAFRFFDTNWSFLGKGIAFVALGLAFLGGNFALARRLRRGKME